MTVQTGQAAADVVFQGVRVPGVSREQEVGGTGAALVGGRFQFAEFNDALKPYAARGLLDDHGVYDKMRRTDPVVNGALLAVELPLIGASWVVEAPDNASDAEKMHQAFVEENLFRRLEGGWTSFLQHAVLVAQYGFMAFEKVYGLSSNGYHVLRRLSPRMPYSVWRWIVDQSGALVAVQQRLRTPGANYAGGLTSAVIPAWKLLLLTNRPEGWQYEGVSVLRQAYGPWFKKDEIDRRDMINFERFGSGIPVFGEPPAFNPEDPVWQKDVEKIREMGRNFRSHEQSYMIRPRGWDFEIAFPKGTPLDATAKLRYYDHQILVNALAMVLDLGNTETGSRALGETFADMFLQALRAYAGVIEAGLNGVNGLPWTGVVRELVDLNFGPQPRYPVVKATKLATKGVAALLPLIKSVAEVGMLRWTEKDETLLRDWLELPSVSVDAEIRPLDPGPAAGGGAQASGPHAAPRGGQRAGATAGEPIRSAGRGVEVRAEVARPFPVASAPIAFGHHWETQPRDEKGRWGEGTGDGGGASPGGPGEGAGRERPSGDDDVAAPAEPQAEGVPPPSLTEKAETAIRDAEARLGEGAITDTSTALLGQQVKGEDVAAINDRLLDSWMGASTDTNALAGKILAGTATPMEQKRFAMAYDNGVKEAAAAAVAGQYAATQKALSDAGITHVEVYRGVYGKQAAELKAALAKGEPVSLGVRPLSSFSETRGTAAEFGEVVVKMRIPAERVFAHHGFNGRVQRGSPSGQSEQEVVFWSPEGGVELPASAFEVVR